jgi:K+-sensing histidine kinase KdpD
LRSPLQVSPWDIDETFANKNSVSIADRRAERKARGLRTVREFVEVAVTITAVTALCRLVPLSYTALGDIYLLAVIALGLRVGRWPMLFAAVASALAWDFFFVTPRMSFAVLRIDDMLLLGTYFVVAIIAGQLTSYIRKHEKLYAASELHRTLLDSVSHELKTPLSVLRSAAEQLDTDDGAKRAHLRTEIFTATSRLDHLVANLLNQTKLESGAVEPQLDWCDARDIINAARRAVGVTLEGRPFKAEVPANMPLFKADQAMMEQAVSNLLINAVRHTPEGTPINIRTGVELRSEWVFISVADRGPGLPSKMRESVFQKFKRGNGAYAGGLGLGLSIVRGFIVAQGGAVIASENPGGGACFTIYLPYGPHGSVPNE